MCKNFVKLAVLLAFFAFSLSFAVDVSTCQAITSSDTYDLTTDLTGAPIAITGISQIDQACLAIQADNVVIDCHGHSISNTGVSDAAGIARNLTSTSTVTIRNCRIAYYHQGISLRYLSGGAVLNNTIFNTSHYGLSMSQSCSGTVVSNNTFHNNTDHALYIGGNSDNNIITNNTLCNTSGAFSAFNLGSNCEYNTFEGNLLYGNYVGIELGYASNNSIENNTIRNNSWHAVVMDHGGDNNLTNNIAYGNYYGFYVDPYSQGNVFVNNTAYDHIYYGFYVYRDNEGTTLINNTAYGNRYGFTVGADSHNTTLWGNTAYENEDGFSIASSDNTLTNNTAYNNTHRGFYLYTGYGNTLINDTAYNNGDEFCVIGSNYTLESFLFLNPSGSQVNYTNLSIGDIMDTSSEEYAIGWGESPGSSPSDRSSFENKYLTISAAGGSPSIDTITWHWQDSETSGYVEAMLELWKYNASGWTLLNNTPDTSANTLTQYAMSPSSTYAIFENVSVDCEVISSPGTYNLSSNLSGAPNPLSTVAGTTAACIIIASLGVTLDCKGFTITNNGTSDAVGIAVNGSSTIDYTGVAIQNCPDIHGYENGVQLYRTAAGTIRNSSMSDGRYGIYVYASQNNSITNNTVHNNSQDGIYLYSSVGNNVTGNTVHSHFSAGIALSTLSMHNNLSNNVLYNNSDPSFYISLSSNNTISNNTVYNTSGSGIYLFSSSECNLTGNTVYDSTSGIELNSNSMRNRVSGNTLYDNAMCGIWLQSSSSNNTVYDTSVSNNTYGIFALQSHDNNFTESFICNNSDYGLYMVSSYGNRLANYSIYGDQYGVYSSSSKYVLDTVSFLPYGGESVDYSALSLTDSNGAGAYRINWSATPGSSPSSRSSFENKFLNISTASGSPNITSIEWSWEDSESSGYTESDFELWKYNASGWTLLNDTPNVFSNTLTQYAMLPGSIYGIFAYETPTSTGGDDEDYSCMTSSDCPECYICSGHECVLPSGSCATSSDCSGSAPFYNCEGCSCVGYECNSASDCGAGYSCEEGECVPPECTQDSDCDSFGAGYSCENYECVPPQCLNDSACGAGGTCSNYVCIPPECTSNSNCGSGKVCENYKCVPWKCKANADCQNGFYCDSGVCRKESIPGGPGGSSGGNGGSGGKQAGESVGEAEVPQEQEPETEQVTQPFPFLEGDTEGGIIPNVVINEETKISGGWVFLFALAAVAVLYFAFHRGRRRGREKEE
ncbi:right-handed parallel beta-helix repeat-containing protein [Candidatus Micrarchaeota archaeon]|nr:right-handed parallel beta-helix repeat-containing protein [Candidatus Micrarchaeota archaeon]